MPIVKFVNEKKEIEVPPGANLNAYAGLAMQFRQRVVQELERLARKYPDHKPRMWDMGM